MARPMPRPAPVIRIRSIIDPKLPVRPSLNLTPERKAIIGRFPQAQAVKRQADRPLQPRPQNLHDILTRAGPVGEVICIQIKMLIIPRLQGPGETIRELAEGKQRAATFIDFPGYRPLDAIAMPVSVKIIAFAVNGSIIIVRQMRAMEAVRRMKRGFQPMT